VNIRDRRKTSGEQEGNGRGQAAKMIDSLLLGRGGEVAVGFEVVRRKITAAWSQRGGFVVSADKSDQPSEQTNAEGGRWGWSWRARTAREAA